MQRLLLALTALILAGCIGNPGDKSITVEHAATAGSALAVTANTSTTFYDLPAEILSSTCVTIVGDQSDPDADGIPTSVVVTVNCTVVNGDETQVITGTITIEDDDPAGPNAFSIAYALDATTTDTSGNSANASIITGADADFSGGAYSVDYGGTEDVSVTNSGSTVVYSKLHGWSVEYTPDSVWTPGDALVAGDMDIEGAWDFSIVGGPQLLAALDTSVPLHVNPACGPDLFDAGTLEAVALVDGLPNIITVTWNGCAPFNISFNGQSVDPPDITPPDFVF